MTVFNEDGTISKYYLVYGDRFPLDEFGDSVQISFFAKCQAILFYERGD